jgi:hypothetical protein
MLRICPKCSAYYANDSLAFCLVDGAPLVSVDQASEKWTEGTRFIEKQTKSLRKQRRRVKWRRAVITMMTMTMITMVLSVVTLNAWFYLKPDAAPSPSPTPTPSPSSSPETSPSSSPETSPSPSPSPTASPTPTPTPSRDVTPTPTPTPVPVHKISGVVTSAGQGLAGVDIKLSGSKSASTKTDSSGRYVFSDLPAGGSYTLAPALMQVIFAPSSRSFSSLGQDESANFAADVFKITGRVMSLAGPRGGVKISLEGSKLTSTTTDASGYYTFSELRAGGSYTVAPRGQAKFEPSRRSFNNLRRDEGADFYQNDATPTPTPTPTPKLVLATTPTPTPTPTPPTKPECTDAEQNAVVQTIRSFEPRWRREIEGERSRIIAQNAPEAAPGHPPGAEATLSQIEFQYAFPQRCKSAVVTASYVWRINYFSAAAPAKSKNVARRRIIGCRKFFGAWVCR